MAAGRSLHIGLNRIDPQHYGTDGKLGGCVNDARSMYAIAKSKGFTPTLLLDAEAKADVVLGALTEASRTLRAGDTLLISYAGHGSQVDDLNFPKEPDGKDETWCLFDRMLVDDELAQAWSAFQPGVRIVLVSDSCHSATVARNLEIISELDRQSRAMQPDVDQLPVIGTPFGNDDRISRYRALPIEIAETVTSRHRDLYGAIQRSTPAEETTSIRATVLSLTACRDDQTAADGDKHGLFTSALLDIWNEGRFTGTYRTLHSAILAKIRVRQEPNYRIDGAADPKLEGELPFTLPGRFATGSTGGTIMATNSIDDRLNALKSRELPRQHVDTTDGHPLCRLELRVPNQMIRDMSEEQVYDFLRNDGADLLMRAFLTASSVTVPRSLEGGIECKADTKGNLGCEAHIGIRF